MSRSRTRIAALWMHLCVNFASCNPSIHSSSIKEDVNLNGGVAANLFALWWLPVGGIDSVDPSNKKSDGFCPDSDLQT